MTTTEFNYLEVREVVTRTWTNAAGRLNEDVAEYFHQAVDFLPSPGDVALFCRAQQVLSLDEEVRKISCP